MDNNERQRRHNDGIRKLCKHAWTRCSCPWHFNYTYEGTVHRYSLNKLLGKPVRSKLDAETAAENIRLAIKDGTFETTYRRRKNGDAPLDPQAPATLRTLGPIFFEKYRNKKTDEPLSANERLRWDLVMRTEIGRANGHTVAIGDLPPDALTRHDLETFRDVHRVKRVETYTDAKGRQRTKRVGGKSGVRGCLRRLSSFYSWAVRKHYATHNPFLDVPDDEDDVLIGKEDGRERRLQPAYGDEPSEQERIFVAASDHLQALIIAALETGCRKGELLSLQWWQVRFDANEIHLPKEKTKNRKSRDIPMSQAMRALLIHRHTDPAGNLYKRDDYVFGDVTGARVGDVKTAWQNAVLKAHGVRVVRKKGSGALSAECQAAYREINVRFHDLRHEAGSRFVESGMAPTHVQAIYGHADLRTTSRYLNITKMGLHAAMQHRDAVEAGKLCKPDAKLAEKPADPPTVPVAPNPSNLLH